MYDEVDIFYINVDDNLTDEDYARYESLKSLDSKIKIKVCPAKWRSCNKLVWAWKDHPNSLIALFDDDKRYPEDCLQNLYNEWRKHDNCIIAYEVNPISIDKNGNVSYHNVFDLKLKQMQFGKWLSNGCLVPSWAFTDLLLDFDKMMELTGGNHDELWFWCVATLNGVQCIGLDATYSLSTDMDVIID